MLHPCDIQAESATLIQAARAVVIGTRARVQIPFDWHDRTTVQTFKFNTVCWVRSNPTLVR